MVQIGMANDAIAAGTLRPLFVIPNQRWPGMPEVPTLREVTGISLSNSASSSTYALFVRASTPPAKVSELNEAIGTIMRSPEITAYAASTSTIARVASPAEFAAEMAEARRTWTKLVAQESFTIDS
jgi:tripartite-type tricarboxylate transporter receptor subunit TctC